MDQQIGRVRRELEALGLLDRTLILLTADHGEGRGEHDEENHGLFLYDTTLTIPLLLRLPGALPAGRVVHQQVRLIDVAPTILSRLGLPPDPAMQGLDLQPLIAGKRSDDRAAYSETLAPFFDYGYAPLRSLRIDGWKYILGPKPELYDLRADPKELTNRVNSEPDRAARMRGALERLLSEGSAIVDPLASRHSAKPDERRGLQGLGYVGADLAEDAGDVTSGDLDRFPPNGLNPMDFAEEIEYVNECVSLMLGRRYAEAEARLRAFLEAREGRTEGLYYALRCLANTLDGMGRSTESITFYQRALAERPTDVMTRTDLGIALRRAKQLEDSVAELRRALTYSLQLPYTRVQLAGSLFELGGHDDEAMEQLRLALAADQNFGEAWGLLGRFEARRNNLAAAVGALRKAVELNPGNVVWRRVLAEVEGRTGAPTP